MKHTKGNWKAELNPLSKNDSADKLGTYCLQPADQTKEMQLLFQVLASAQSAMFKEVDKIFKRIKMREIDL